MSERPHVDVCCRTTPITAQDIHGGPDPARRVPFVITAPGQYALVEDVDWVAADEDARAITIASDDVTLDLCGRTLRQVAPPAPALAPDAPHPGASPRRGEVVSGNVGIFAEGRRRLVIKNGSVLGIQGVGIAVKACRQVELRELSVSRCGGDGAIDTTFLRRNGGIFVMGVKDADGNITFASDVRMLDCVCTENTSRLDSVVTLGALVLFCDNVEVKRCVFNRTANTSARPSGVQFNVVGVDFVICRNVLVEDCEAHDNTSGGEPAGFFAWGENYKFLRCRANRNFTLTGNRACGFNVSTTSNLEMVDCEADGNYNANPGAPADPVRDFSAVGFRIGRAVVRGLLENCRAMGNHSAGENAPAAGFALHATRHVVLRRCVAVGNRNASGAAENDGLAAGFIASSPLEAPEGGLVGGADNAFIDCIADGNTVHRDPLFVQPPAPPVDAGPSRGDPRKGAGFLLDRQTGARIVGCQSANNDGKGIWLRACARVVVEGNTLSRNALYGIQDEDPAGPSVFIGNRAYLNGSRHRHNYVGLPPGTPILKWTLGSPQADDAPGRIANLSVRLP